MTSKPVFGISGVRYDPKHSHIDRVLVHAIKGETILKKEWEWSRAEVVQKIRKGSASFVTLPREKGRLRRGQKVQVWRKVFIRSIPNSPHREDNLAAL